MGAYCFKPEINQTSARADVFNERLRNIADARRDRELQRKNEQKKIAEEALKLRIQKIQKQEMEMKKRATARVNAWKQHQINSFVRNERRINRRFAKDSTKIVYTE